MRGYDDAVKIATWNLERGRSRRARESQTATLREVDADLVVLTEPPASFQPDPGDAMVASPPERLGSAGRESWVAIVTGLVLTPVGLEIPFDRMAVAAHVLGEARNVVIYGSVLPWGSIRSHAPDLVRGDASAFAAFVRVVGEQVEDIEALRMLYPRDLIVWAGDFNQTLTGPCRSGSLAKRQRLASALARLGFEAWNRDVAHARPGLRAIDLICGPKEVVVADTGRIDPVRDGLVMSDHAGYWVEI